MAQSGAQIKLAPNGHIMVAPLGSAEPADVTTAWDAAWTELGFADDGGVDLTPKITTNDIPVWQQAGPAKVIIQASSLTLDFSLVQTNADILSFFFFGSTWTVSGGIARLTIPSSPENDERMMGIEWGDDTVTNRLVLPRGMATDRQKVTMNRKTEQMYGITFEALDLSGNLAYILSNDPDIVSGA